MFKPLVLILSIPKIIHKLALFLSVIILMILKLQINIQIIVSSSKTQPNLIDLRSRLKILLNYNSKQNYDNFINFRF